MVTIEPQAGDAEVYGDAWPPVREWRGLQLSHRYEGAGVNWLESEMKLRQLDIALIGEHGLTLTHDTDPWDSRERKTQVRWRNQTFKRMRKELFWARVMRCIRWRLTANLWRK